MSVLVAKADGTEEPFNPEKLVASLMRAGAEHGLARDIARAVEAPLVSGTTTHEIYRRAFAKLRDARRGVAARYSLKRALLEFGPSGFPFEAYLAELFRAEGYTAKTDQIVRGKCVEHEVDVVLQKGGITTYVEAKFHNAAGFKTDLKTVYTCRRGLKIWRDSTPITRAIYGVWWLPIQSLPAGLWSTPPARGLSSLVGRSRAAGRSKSASTR